MIRPRSLAALLAASIGALGSGLGSPAVAGAGVLGGDAAACAAAQGPAVQVNVLGLKDRTGEVKLELYPATEADFLKDDNVLVAEGKVFRRVRAAAPASGPVSLCIRVPKPGRYALLFTHNRDGKNKFSIWNDGAGIVSNARIGRGKPKVGQSIVDVGPAVTTVTIRAQYLHGFGGFSPAA